jgi:cytoskeletal protein CcmA (bactofilin family)
VSAGRATIAGQVHGDLILAAGNAMITGDILDDALILGGSVSVLGLVGDDLRIAGGQVAVGGSVGGELVAAGGDVSILPDADIEGDLYVAGGEVTIDGTVRGDVFFTGGRLTLNGVVLGDVRASLKKELRVGESAVVGGTLRYGAPREAELPGGFVSAGRVLFSGPVRKVATGGGFFGLVFLQSTLGLLIGIIFTLRLLAWLGLAVLIAWVWRRWAQSVVEEFARTFFKSLGQGIVVFILVPLAIALLLLSFIGTLVGFAGIALYVLLLIFARAFAAIALGAWLGKLIQKRKTWRITIPWTIVGVIVLQVVHLLPLLGWLLSIALSLAMMGVLFRSALQQAHRS